MTRADLDPNGGRLVSAWYEVIPRKQRAGKALAGIGVRTQFLALRFSSQVVLLVLFFMSFRMEFWDKISLCSLGCPGIHPVDQSGFELRVPPASVTQVLGIKACATLSGQELLLKCYILSTSGNQTVKQRPVEVILYILYSPVPITYRGKSAQHSTKKVSWTGGVRWKSHRTVTYIHRKKKLGTKVKMLLVYTNL